MKDTTLLTFEDALNYLGAQGTRRFVIYMAMGNNIRIGQAWFNALSDALPEEADKLRGTLADPFQQDNKVSVIEALRFLLLYPVKK